MTHTNTINKGQIVTKQDVENLMQGDLVVNCFGEIGTVEHISYKGVDMNGKAFACFYQTYGNGSNSILSNSIKEGETVFTIK